jgi:hypothetical protein
MTRKKLALKLTALSSAGIILITGNAFAALQQWNLKPPGTGSFDWTHYTEHDFALSSYSTVGGIKYFQLQGQNASTNGHCIELETTSAGSEADTRIWLFDGTNYRSVNDDFGGTHLSKARFWMLGSAASLDYIIHVRAYSSGAAYDSIKFNLVMTRRDISEAACTTGQTTIPWAKMKMPGGIANYGAITFGNGAG